MVQSHWKIVWIWESLAPTEVKLQSRVKSLSLSFYLGDYLLPI